jgi:DNA-binding response OmpR family regulator
MPKILIVEDDLVTAKTYEWLLKKDGFDAYIAPDGESAQTALKHTQPDLVLLDLMLPKVPGTIVLKSIRSNPATITLPVIVLTNGLLASMLKAAYEAGANLCMHKSECTPERLLEMVRKLLKLDKGPQSSTPLASIEAPTPSAPPQQPPLAPESSASPVVLPTTSGELGVNTTAPSVATGDEFPWEPKLEEVAPGSSQTPRNTVPIQVPPPSAAPQQPVLASKPSAATALVNPSSEAPSTTTPQPPVVATGYQGQLQPQAPIAGPSPDGAGPGKPLGGDTSVILRVNLRESFAETAPQVAKNLRARMPLSLKNHSQRDCLAGLFELYQVVHGLASSAAMASLLRTAHLAGALEAFLQELFEDPASVNDSTIRTVGHATELLAILLESLGQNAIDAMAPSIILEVDDEALSRRTVCTALELAKLKCITVDSPELALRLCQENRFDLIFSDVEMPGKSGLDLCAEIRALRTNQTTPVVIVTALSGFDIRARSTMSGGSDFITKPFLLTELAVKALTWVIKQQQSSQTGRRDK